MQLTGVETRVQECLSPKPTPAVALIWLCETVSGLEVRLHAPVGPFFYYVT